MNTQFDFTKFKKRIKTNATVGLNLVSVDMKAGASLPESDEDGNINESPLDEIQDENVNFIFTGQYINDNDPSDIGTFGGNLPRRIFNSDLPYETIYRRYGQRVVDELSLVNYDNIPYIKTTGVNKFGTPVTYTVQIMPRHNLMKDNDILTDISITSVIDSSTGSYNIRTFSLASNAYVTTYNESSFMNIISNSYANHIIWLVNIESTIESISGRYYVTSMTQNSLSIYITIPLKYTSIISIDNTKITLISVHNTSVTRNPQVDYLVFQALGMFPMSKRGIGNTSGRPILSKKAYYSRLKSLTDRAIQSGFEVLTTNYLPDIETLADGTKIDKNTSYLSRKTRSKTDVMNAANIFMSLKGIQEIPSNEITPYQPSVKEAFRSWYAQDDELYADSFNTLESIITTLKQGKDTGFIIDSNNYLDVILNDNNFGYNMLISDDIIALGSQSILGTGFGTLTNIAFDFLSNINELKSDLNRLKTQIKTFEYFTGESIFDTGELLGSGVYIHSFLNKYARILIPVDFGISKQKKSVKGPFGISIKKTIKTDIGVRWVELKFIDTSVSNQFRKNEIPSGKVNSTLYTILTSSATRNGSSTIVTATISPDYSIPVNSVVEITTNSFNDKYYNGTFTATLLNSNTLKFTIVDKTIYNDNVEVHILPNTTTPISGVITKTITKLEPSQPDNTPVKTSIYFDMPNLPNDISLKNKVFLEYGYFNQIHGAYRSRTGINSIEDNAPDGYTIFKDTSKEIKDLHNGIGVYEKASFLYKILQSEFGISRVKLVETRRSLEDQDNLIASNDQSKFLSWYNYGLAVKILIVEKDGYTKIKEGSDDFYRLLNIAEAYTEICKEGKLGNPCDVIWGARLAVGPDMFTWEYIPFGLTHKEAYKFRDSYLNQLDAYQENAFINVDSNGYVTENNNINSPYINKNSKYYKKGLKINGTWVSPKNIINYKTPDNLILKDIKEFLTLVNIKMKVNGTSLPDDKNINAWKTRNPISFNQLVTYYGLIGNFSAVRGLISGDYVSKYKFITTMKTTDPISFVKTYLGDDYFKIKLYIDSQSDGSYIRLSDGKMFTQMYDIQPDTKAGNINMFGQQKLNRTLLKFGQWKNGKFLSKETDNMLYTVTDTPIINGYVFDSSLNDYIPSIGDSIVLHKIVMDVILNEYNEIKSNYDNLKIKFMFDSVLNGSNASSFQTLENEFGIIQAQDLISFDSLKQILKKVEIDKNKQRGLSDIENNAIFEKMVSNARTAGVKLTNITGGKLIIEPLKSNTTVKNQVDIIQRTFNIKPQDII